MSYNLVGIYLLVFHTEVLNLSDSTMWLISSMLMILRVLTALVNPVLGMMIENTDTAWGKFKPSILIGVLVSSFFLVLMFSDLGMGQLVYLFFFTVIYILWDVFYSANDIAYWSMLPTLSIDQKEREKIGAFARICANAGVFAIVVIVLPMTGALGEILGSVKKAWFSLALLVALLTIGFQLFTLLGVKEKHTFHKAKEKTSLKEMACYISRNDQLLFTAIMLALFMIGYLTTLSYSAYFFKYAFRNENMYPLFAVVLGISQFSALLVFPLVSKVFSRKQLYFSMTLMVIFGYAVFFLSPMNIVMVGIACVFIFVGQTFIQLLMLMFLTDTIEYGQWVTGKRNESITFSILPLVNKICGAITSWIVSSTLIISGINSADSATDITSRGILIMKLTMLILPLVFTLASFFVYSRKYRIDGDFYRDILADLRKRGDLGEHINQ
jgi:lactose/raffinose/galactose permease